MQHRIEGRDMILWRRIDQPSQHYITKPFEGKSHLLIIWGKGLGVPLLKNLRASASPKGILNQPTPKNLYSLRKLSKLLVFVEYSLHTTMSDKGRSVNICTYPIGGLIKLKTFI